jgi:hypothetical protein
MRLCIKLNDKKEECKNHYHVVSIINMIKQKKYDVDCCSYAMLLNETMFGSPMNKSEHIKKIPVSHFNFPRSPTSFATTSVIAAKDPQGVTYLNFE